MDTDIIAKKCFGIYLQVTEGEHFITDLSQFGRFGHDKIRQFMLASIKEISSRIDKLSVVDIELEYYKKVYLVGITSESHQCFIFTTEEKPHQHLITLCRYVKMYGLAQTISENFDYIKKEVKTKKILEDLEIVKYTMIQNIDAVLTRGEKLDDLVIRTQYLSEDSKKFYQNAKRLNRCCVIV